MSMRQLLIRSTLALALFAAADAHAARGGDGAVAPGRSPEASSARSASVAFDGPRAAYLIAPRDGGYVVTNRRDGAAVTVASGVARLRFDDVTLALDIDGLAGSAYRLYRAAFDRAPDHAGLAYWIGVLDQGGTVVNVAADFVASAEFADLYGARPSDGQFVDLLYGNVLHRAPDQAGRDYWTAALGRGASRATVLAQFSDSAENVAQVVDDVADGIEFGDVADPVFVAPSGPLCERQLLFAARCATPTASAADLDTLRTALVAADGPLVGFTLPGRTHTWAFTLKTPPDAGYVASHQSYDVIRKTIVLGQGGVRSDGQAYLPASPRIKGGSEFLHAETVKHATFQVAETIRAVAWRANQLYGGTGVPPGPVQGSYWDATLGLLTDSATAPDELTVTFTGFVFALAGDAELDGYNLRTGGATCPISIELHVASGEVAAAAIDCVDQYGQRLAFSLPALKVRQSRIVAEPAARVAVAVTGTEQSSTTPFSSSWTSTRIDGAVFGPGAAALTIVGAGADGHFEVVAARDPHAVPPI